MNDNIFFDRKKIQIVVVALIGLILGTSTGVMAGLYINESKEYNDLLNNYQIITGDYDTLFDDYQDLQNSYDAICLAIKQLALPIQFCAFAEAVRRYYMPIYFNDNWDESTGEYWMAYAKFCRDIVLHDTKQYNAFNVVSEAFSDALLYGSDTMKLCRDTMWNLYEDAYFLFTPEYEFNGIEFKHSRCIEIDYEQDERFTRCYPYSSFEGDYIKFSVETALRNKGEIEDQSILETACLESCGFETIMWFIYDPSWFDNYYDTPRFDAYHINTFVHIQDTDYFFDNYPGYLMEFSEEIDPYYSEATWCPLELGPYDGFEEDFGTFPSWIEYYEPTDEAIVTMIVCDINGEVEQIIF